MFWKKAVSVISIRKKIFIKIAAQYERENPDKPDKSTVFVPF